MIELIKHYGLWIVLAAVFIAMYWFGEVICAREHSRDRSHAVQAGPAPAAGIQSALGFLRRLFGL
ncbi:MAG: hypothetical protein AAB254_00080, partial [candidate division NC10 bacterium]